MVRSTIQGVHHQGLQALADKIIAEVPATEPELLEPAGADNVRDEDILAFLVREGLRPGAAEELTSALRRIWSLARYYYDKGQWDVVREHETRTFLTMPLLLALGWAEQQIKIELPVGGNQRADIACFRRPYRVDGNGNTNDGDCVLILEAKSFSQGLTYTREQAVRYAEHFPNCRVIVATNGYCYKT